MESTELAKPRTEASALVRLVQLEQQHSVNLGKGFFSSKGVSTRGYNVKSETAQLEHWLEQLPACTDTVAADAYGEHVLIPYWPFQILDRDDNDFNALLVKLLVISPYFSARELMFTDLAREFSYRYAPRVRKAPAELREPAPTLPWLFSKDIGIVLDARDKPLVAFTYAWVELVQLSQPSPPDVPTCAHVKPVTHTVDVPYKTSLPLLCTFAAPPQPMPLSGSFFASPVDGDFYRGMTPSALMQRRRLRADDMME